MKETGLIFGTESVGAILDGSKTMTRRVIVPRGKTYKFMREHGYNTIQHDEVIYPDGGGNWIGWDKDSPGLAEFTKKAYPNGEGFKCPYGQVGDRLWVRETCKIQDFGDTKGVVAFKTTSNPDPSIVDLKWTPSMFMPRWASRITLEITALRVERLQEITQDDAIAEGMRHPEHAFRMIAGGDVEVEISPKEQFAEVWDSLNAKRGYGWDKNPWVWVISFRRLR